MTASRTITVYTREQCHLCGDALETIRRVADSVSPEIEVRTIDVDTEPELEAAYGERVPYVLIDGRPRFKYRVEADELRRYLTIGG